ncbi:MAG: glycoside hydrolase family 5 protein [Treponema sp.]|nr:glycoside hydrolase family 5 protein [Treponema sp.]
MKKLKRIAFGIIAAAITLCSACAKAQKKDSIAKNLGELSWSNNITIEASLFSNAQKDSVIEISAQQTKADYHKFKLYSVGNGWKEVGSGGVTGASFANGEITVEKKSCTISVKLTEDDASSLKSGGMVLHGFGLSIKKMEMVNPASSTNAAQKAGKAQEKPAKQEKAAKSQNANLPFDLGNWKNFVVSAKDLHASGDFSIKISTSASSSEKNPSYFNLKLYDANWQPISKGSIQSSKEFASLKQDLFVLTKAEGFVVYTPTEAERNAIKNKGLIIQGYGISVNDVKAVTIADLHAKSAPEPAVVSKPAPSAKGSSLPKATQGSPKVTQGTPFANHGKLHVTGTSLCDSKNQPYQLYGMSTHGLSWFPEYVSKESFTSLRDDWNTNCVRLVLYPGDYMGYCNGGNKEQLKRTVYRGIEEATALGMYVIVDWHIHNDNPNKYKAEAKKFLDEVSKKYADYGNILYEICNEPVNAEWKSQIKPYAEEIIPVIRKNAPDAIIIVGTNTWSQDVDKAAANPITKYKNIMYTFHFYANTHTDSFRSKVEGAIKAGLPIFITEFGTCDASGNGGFNEQQTKLWFNLIQKYNLSHMNWSLCNKAETASAISASCQKKSGWTDGDLSESGRLIRSHFRSLSR